ncbi:MAG: lamin tail domain-containing protein [Ignavibacteria bacterium]|jgi:hypothetical protein|nr:lamin tail domain-containing protein [Ignavibacteria bacterium]
MSFNFYRWFKLIVAIILLLLIQACDKSTEPEQKDQPKRLKLYINEFMASNKSTIADEKNQYDDWVELYNGEDTTINLNQFYLTDDFNRKNKWLMPNVSIQPKKWILIWCDEDSAQGILHSNFKLSAAGEQLGIFSLSLEAIDTITYGPQKTDTSFGRFPDGSNFWKFMNPTPNNFNQ